MPLERRKHTHPVLIIMVVVVSALKSCPVLRPQGLWPARLLSMGFSRGEFYSGLPFPSSGDLINPGVEPGSPALAGGIFTD